MTIPYKQFREAPTPPGYWGTISRVIRLFAALYFLTPGEWALAAALAVILALGIGLLVILDAFP